MSRPAHLTVRAAYPELEDRPSVRPVTTASVTRIEVGDYVLDEERISCA